MDAVDKEIQLQEITDGTKSGRDKLNDWKKAIEALQSESKNNPFKGYSPYQVIGLVDGVGYMFSIPAIVQGPVT